MTIEYPKIDYYPCSIQFRVQENKIHTFIDMENPVDITLPYPNGDKSYTTDDIRRIIGTLLEEHRLFSFITWKINVDYTDKHMRISIVQPTAQWSCYHSEFYQYHTVMNIVDLLFSSKNGIFGCDLDADEGRLTLRFMPCRVEGLEERAKEHLDD